MPETGFLTLARSSGESITLQTAFGETIVIYFDAIHTKQCKVSIEAPLDVNIVRTELLDDPNLTRLEACS